MAIAAFALANDGVAGSSPYTTASITPGSNRLVLATIVNEDTTTTPSTPTLAGNGLTWVQVATRTFDTEATPRARITLFRAMGASPTTGAVTITAAGTEECSWSIVEFSGVDTSGTNGSGAIVQSVANSANSVGSLTVTLAAFADAVNNAAFGGFGVGANAALNPGTGFAEIGADLNHAASEWRLGQDTTVDMSGDVVGRGGIALEIKAATLADRMFQTLLGVGR